MRLLLSVITLNVLMTSGALAEPARYTLHTEAGFLAVLDHTIKFGKQGTDFNFVRDGGQDTLLAIQRFSVDRKQGRHILTLLYQPLDLQSNIVLRKELSTDGTLFPAGTPLAVRYSFPYYRASWMYDLAEDPANELALGLSLQIRNTIIQFSSLDGNRVFRASNIGPVPVLKARGRLGLADGAYVGFEADGFYAPVSYLNGSDEEIVGAILDASLRAGQAVREDLELFMNLRYLGGGAVGSNEDEAAPRDGYVKNWLHFSTLTFGISWTP